jgi:hypothetical protein
MCFYVAALRLVFLVFSVLILLFYAMAMRSEWGGMNVLARLGQLKLQKYQKAWNNGIVASKLV